MLDKLSGVVGSGSRVRCNAVQFKSSAHKQTDICINASYFPALGVKSILKINQRSLLLSSCLPPPQEASHPSTSHAQKMKNNINPVKQTALPPLFFHTSPLLFWFPFFPPSPRSPPSLPPQAGWHTEVEEREEKRGQSGPRPQKGGLLPSQRGGWHAAHSAIVNWRLMRSATGRKKKNLSTCKTTQSQNLK